MRDDLVEWADNRFLGDPRFSKRKTFGCPSWYLGKKMAAFVFDDGLVIKLPRERVEEEIAKDPEAFDYFRPSDGVMKGWLKITRAEAGEYEQDEPLIEESIEYVGA